MNHLEITFKQMESTEAIKSYVEKKIKKIEKLIKYPVKTHVILNIEKLNHLVEITCYAEHKEIASKGNSENLYESIDEAVGKLETQLKKEREKKKNHHHEEIPSEIDLEVEIPHRNKH